MGGEYERERPSLRRGSGDGTLRRSGTEHGKSFTAGGLSAPLADSSEVGKDDGGARSTEEAVETQWREGALIQGGFQRDEGRRRRLA